MTVRITRHLTLLEEVDDDHPAVAMARGGLPVDPSLLPVSLLGRDPSAVVGSIWYAEADGEEPVQIYLTGGQ